MGELGLAGGGVGDNKLWTQLSSVSCGERLWLQTEPLTAYLGKLHPKTPKQLMVTLNILAHDGERGAGPRLFFFLLGCYVYKSNVWVFNFRFVQDDF